MHGAGHRFLLWRFFGARSTNGTRHTKGADHPDQRGGVGQPVGGFGGADRRRARQSHLDSVLHNRGRPHVEPKTTAVDTLQKAQVVVSNGAGYDSWATKNLERDTVSVSAAQMVGAVEGDNPHLWFSSDARNAMAKELADTYSRIMPKQKKYFTNKLKAWNRRETVIERSMKEFSNTHRNVSYAATEPVAYYLLSDMGLSDKTPESYTQSISEGSQPSSKELQDFQKILEGHQVDMLINNVQKRMMPQIF